MRLVGQADDDLGAPLQAADSRRDVGGPVLDPAAGDSAEIKRKARVPSLAMPSRRDEDRRGGHVAGLHLPRVRVAVEIDARIVDVGGPESSGVRGRPPSGHVLPI